MALGHVHIAIARVRYDVRGVRQRFGRIAPHAGFTQRHENLAVGAELDDDAPFVLFSGKFLEVICSRGSSVSHPYIAISIDMDAMRPHEHSGAKAPDLLA